MRVIAHPVFLAFTGGLVLAFLGLAALRLFA
jgi:hypothetical protein